MKLNWNLIIAAAIAGLPPTIMAVASFNQAGKTHDLVNSRMTQLLEIATQAAADAATLKEKKAELERQDKAAD